MVNFVAKLFQLTIKYKFYKVNLPDPMGINIRGISEAFDNIL